MKDSQHMEGQSQDYKEGYSDGFALALGLVGADLSGEPVQDYTLEDYGKDYLIHAKHINSRDCANCHNPVILECVEVVGFVFCPLSPSDSTEGSQEWSQDCKEGFVKGFAQSLGLVGENLCDEFTENCSFEDCGNGYLTKAEHIDSRDCANCQNPVMPECIEIVGFVFCPLSSID